MLKMQIDFGSLYLQEGNYEFSLSRDQFLRAVALAIEKEWLTAEQIRDVLDNPPEP